METNSFYNEILTYHNAHPMHKHDLEPFTVELEGLNPTCGDDIFLRLSLKDNRIEDGAFTGDGCAISQASADIMLDMIRGKTKEQALHLADLFIRMIKEGLTDEEMEELEEAGALQDIRHMPARVKCAVLAWHTLQQALENGEDPA